MTAAGFWLAAVCVCGPAQAGAWPLDPGETLAIVKFEHAEADEVWDREGDRQPAPDRTDESASLYLERGLTRRLTLQAKLAWSRGDDAGAGFEGRGPAEMGLRYAFVDSDGLALSLYGGAIIAGEGRNIGYAPPGVGTTDYELRLLAGRSFELAGHAAFAEAQVARIDRSGVADETRLDLTFGYEPTPRWLLLLQSYSGVSVADPAWLKVEASAVRRAGLWSLQAGWRVSAVGRASPVDQGPVFAVWRAF